MPVYNNKEYIRIMRPLPSFVQRDPFSIPVVEPEHVDISQLNNGLWLTNMKNANHKDKNAHKKIVHSFSYDDVLLRAYNNPLRYIKKVSKYYAVSTPDFSMDEKMDQLLIIYAVYCNRWMGAFMQSYGITTIPCVGWVTERTYDICFSGIRDGGTFIISTLGVNNCICSHDFLQGYYELRKRFPNTTLICVGDKISGMDTDICYIKYEESFGNWDRYSNYWQPKLFNWDMSIPFGGDTNVI